MIVSARAMRLIARAATIAGALYGAVGCAPAIAGGQVGIAVGPPAPVFVPSPGYIPAPLPLPPQPNGAGVAPVQPLPPLVLYTTPTVVAPLPPREGGHRR